jgi:hypothetical protein
MNKDELKNLKSVAKCVELIAKTLNNIDQRLMKLEHAHEAEREHADYIFGGAGE